MERDLKSKRKSILTRSKLRRFVVGGLGVALTGTALLAGSAQAANVPAPEGSATTTNASNTIAPQENISCARKNGDAATGWACSRYTWRENNRDYARAIVTSRRTGGQVWATWNGTDHKLTVCDKWPNGASTRAHIAVTGDGWHGPYKSAGGKCVTHKVNVVVGQTVNLYVYTSGADIAVYNASPAVGGT